jgi:hypothetical protein
MTEQMTPLRRRMIDDMTLRNMSPLTQKAYVRAVKNFSKFFRHSPRPLLGRKFYQSLGRIARRELYACLGAVMRLLKPSLPNERATSSIVITRESG